MSKSLLILTALLLSVAATAAARADLTLDEALAAALETRPELAAADARWRAAAARAEQAGAWPNPAGFLRLEDAPRDGDAWNGANRIVGLSQTLPLGGRTGAARRTAETAAATRGHERDALLRAVAAEVRAAHARAVHAGETFELRREAVVIARRLLEAAASRVTHGDAPASDLRRARGELGVAEAEAAAAEADDVAARVALATAIGDGARPVGATRDDADGLPVPVDLDALLTSLDEAPLTRAAASRADEEAARVGEASRARIPDLDLEAGLREAPAGAAFDLGFRISLPIFDRGGARLASARADAEAAAALSRAARRDLEARLRRAHAELTAAALGAAIYRDTVVPEARAALRSAEAAYAAGDSGLSEVLLVRRDWLEARRAALDLRRDAELARAELEALL